MVRKRSSQRGKKRLAASPGAELPTVDVSRIRLRLQGWFLRTLRVDTSGDYGKLQHLLELFLLQAETRLQTHLWDRGTEAAVEEALQHLAQRWGPKFRQALELEVQVMDTHLKFSLTVPQGAVERSKKGLTSKQQRRHEAAAERSLYVVKRLANRLHVGPAGRQLVFWYLVGRGPGFGLKRRRRVG